MQITNNFSGEKKESSPKFLPPLKKAFMHPSTVSQGVCVHYTKYLQRYPFDKEWDLLIKPIAVLREKRELAGPVWRH